MTVFLNYSPSTTSTRLRTEQIVIISDVGVIGNTVPLFIRRNAIRNVAENGMRTEIRIRVGVGVGVVIGVGVGVGVSLRFSPLLAGALCLCMLLRLCRSCCSCACCLCRRKSNVL